jgi:hypothetical protein
MTTMAHRRGALNKGLRHNTTANPRGEKRTGGGITRGSGIQLPETPHEVNNRSAI